MANTRRAIVAGIVMSSLMACGEQAGFPKVGAPTIAPASIEGRWRSTVGGGGGEIEFRSDGTLAGDPSLPRSGSGTWRASDNGTYVITQRGEHGPATELTAILVDGGLVLRTSAGQLYGLMVRSDREPVPPSPETRPHILGRWETLNGEEHWQFLSDGTIGTDIALAGSGRWAQLDDGRYSANVTGFGGVSIVWVGTVVGDYLVLENQDREYVMLSRTE